MLLSLLILIIGLVGLDAAQPSNHTCSHEINKAAPCFEIGEKDLLDRELHKQEYKKGGFILIKKDEDIVFPPGGGNSNWFTLTSVNVTNLMPNGKEGLVTWTAGGVGQHNITLHLESQRGEGYHFLVIITGKDSDYKKSA